MNQKTKNNVYSELVERITSVIQENMKIEKQIQAVLGKKYEKKTNIAQESA